MNDATHRKIHLPYACLVFDTGEYSVNALPSISFPLFITKLTWERKPMQIWMWFFIFLPPPQHRDSIFQELNIVNTAHRVPLSSQKSCDSGCAQYSVLVLNVTYAWNSWVLGSESPFLPTRYKLQHCFISYSLLETIRKKYIMTILWRFTLSFSLGFSFSNMKLFNSQCF